MCDIVIVSVNINSIKAITKKTPSANSKHSSIDPTYCVCKNDEQQGKGVTYRQWFSDFQCITIVGDVILLLYFLLMQDTDKFHCMDLAIFFPPNLAIKFRLFCIVNRKRNKKQINLFVDKYSAKTSYKANQ